MPTVPVKPELLRWAITRSGLPKDMLLSRFPKLNEWTTGDRLPTFRQLEDFARTTMTPLGALFLDTPPDEKLPLPDFRTKNDHPLTRYSPNLLDTIHTIQQRQAWLKDWLKAEQSHPLEYVGKAQPTINYKTLADEIRHELKLDADWAERLPNWEDALNTLRIATERAGIVVFSNSVVGLNNHRPLDPEEFRGFVLCDSLAPVVFINDADTKSARIFTLAHELVHVWLGTDGVFNLDKMMPATAGMERYCNIVAAEFLVPEHKLSARWGEARNLEQPFQALASWFKVSPIVAARRALDLKLITKTEFFRFYEEDRDAWLLRRAENREHRSGGNFYATQSSRLGQRFSTAVVRAAREGRLLYNDAFRLTGMSGTTFHTYADRVLQRVRVERE